MEEKTFNGTADDVVMNNPRMNQPSMANFEEWWKGPRIKYSPDTSPELIECLTARDAWNAALASIDREKVALEMLEEFKKTDNYKNNLKTMNEILKTMNEIVFGWYVDWLQSRIEGRKILPD
jgi:hypothetical protein